MILQTNIYISFLLYLFWNLLSLCYVFIESSASRLKIIHWRIQWMSVVVLFFCGPPLLIRPSAPPHGSKCTSLDFEQPRLSLSTIFIVIFVLFREFVVFLCFNFCFVVVLCRNFCVVILFCCEILFNVCVMIFVLLWELCCYISFVVRFVSWFLSV